MQPMARSDQPLCVSSRGRIELMLEVFRRDSLSIARGFGTGACLLLMSEGTDVISGGIILKW